jgi:Succinylglutamate desuccinylase / Aspartoacylase family
MLRATVEFDKPGKQTGFIEVPHSVHDDAWGVIPVPVAVISNGLGPTVILEGGNHGDEYEGPIVLGELIRTLDPRAVSGRLIFIPAINLPAVAAARRTSPIDDLNFNRAFPGDPLGSPTLQIVAYVNDVLFPMADAFLDLHSGGSSLMITPSAIIEPVADPTQHARNTAATLAFGASMTVAIDNRGDPRTATASAARATLQSWEPKWRAPERFRSTRWRYVGEACATSSHILARCPPRWPIHRKRPRGSTTFQDPTRMSWRRTRACSSPSTPTAPRCALVSQQGEYTSLLIQAGRRLNSPTTPMASSTDGGSPEKYDLGTAVLWSLTLGVRRDALMAGDQVRLDPHSSKLHTAARMDGGASGDAKMRA